MKNERDDGRRDDGWRRVWRALVLSAAGRKARMAFIMGALVAEDIHGQKTSSKVEV